MGVLVGRDTYLVDAIRDLSAEVIAGTKCSFSPLTPSCSSHTYSCFASTGGSAVALPLIQSIGIVATNGIAMVIVSTSLALICAIIKHRKS